MPDPVSPLRKRSFPAIVSDRTRLLILGSLPGERSLAEARYYAHPRNQFWLLMGFVLETDLAGLPYCDRLAVLQESGIGLWDVVQSASRHGSLDASIRDHLANPLATLAKRLPKLAAIAFNGAKASTIGRKELGAATGVTLVSLPSSSPAHTLSLAEKRDSWLQLRAFLQDAAPLARPSP